MTSSGGVTRREMEKDNGKYPCSFWALFEIRDRENKTSYFCVIPHGDGSNECGFVKSVIEHSSAFECPERSATMSNNELDIGSPVKHEFGFKSRKLYGLAGPSCMVAAAGES